ncbi:MAG TPA: tetratricopeptide repeat protein [Pyrinomonadaceae bacterium]|nr:tetratricopeptide repeat protein [Pyrinomonadaceae bacterium]
MTEWTDFSRLLNPYDFANPVSSQELFCGRERELKDIRYYLDQAKLTSRPMNLALLGARAAGKTSLLNMIELEAKERGFCVARIDLNENDAASELAFFFKLFDGVFSAACSFERSGESGQPEFPFGGMHGKTYDTYVDMTVSLDLPEDKTWCPFRFPIRYAKAMSKGVDSKVSDREVKNDLTVISDELKCNVAILFDECNVLADHRVLLQMLRNIFMNLPGFMLVFTGTPDLFPVMDEVFSPIARQFKKIEVGPFQKQGETRDCISKPLESIGLTNLREMFEQDTYRELEQMQDMTLHGLTGGRPYEIQLLCHFMFKRVQLGQAPKMELNLEVLDDVLSELEQGRKLQDWPTIVKIRSLSDEEIKALDFLTSCDGYVTLDQLWFTEYSLRKEQRWTRAQLDGFLTFFCDQGVLDIKEDIIRFNGDDFERIYCKYYARQRRVRLSLDSVPYEHFVNLSLCIPFQMFYNLKGFSNTVWREDEQDATISHVYPTLSAETYDVFDLLQGMRDGGKSADIYKLYPDLGEALYWLCIRSHAANYGEVLLLDVLVRNVWISRHYPFYYDVEMGDNKVEQFATVAESVRERAASLGGDIKVDIRNIELPSKQALVDGVLNSGNAALRLVLSARHDIQMTDHYLRGRDLKQALFHAELARIYDSEASPERLNNMGYIHTAQGEIEKARPLFATAVDEYRGGDGAALPLYNLGVVNIMLGDRETARTSLSSAVELASRRKGDENRCACLFVPFRKDGVLALNEEEQPDLLECSARALALLDQLS